MDRHNIPTHLLESLHCTYIKDYCLKESVFDRDRDLFFQEENDDCQKICPTISSLPPQYKLISHIESGIPMFREFGLLPHKKGGNSMDAFTTRNEGDCFFRLQLQGFLGCQIAGFSDHG